jgi:hypothetical protein
LTAAGTRGDAGRRYRTFGSHSSNESMAGIYYKKLTFIAFFNAGVRALDIRDPYHPKEAGYFIPSITPATDKRCVALEGVERCKVAIQTNNVETDDRGYIYAVDRANRCRGTPGHARICGDRGPSLTYPLLKSPDLRPVP